MTLAETGRLVAGARAAGHAVGAFNVIGLEHAEAVVEGAEAAGRPAVLQISQNCVRFHGGRLRPIAAATLAMAGAATVDVAVHLDHMTDVALLAEADAAGIRSAMFDGSRLPFAANVEATRAVVRRARERGVWVEAELGEVGGKPGAHAAGARTDPAMAAEFVAATGVDALAVAVGSTHRMTTRTATLDLELITRLAAAVAVPLVLHGSSGVRADRLGAGVAAGLVKINFGTALNAAFTGAVRERLAAEPEAVDPRPYLAAARSAVAATVAELLTMLAGPPG